MLKKSSNSLNRTIEEISLMSPIELTKWLKIDEKARIVYSYQKTSVVQMLRNASLPTSERHGSILGDEMGLGKTFQALCVIRGLENLYVDQPTAVIVVPKCVLDNNQWQDEARHFGWSAQQGVK